MKTSMPECFSQNKDLKSNMLTANVAWHSGTGYILLIFRLKDTCWILKSNTVDTIFWAGTSIGQKMCNICQHFRNEILLLVL